MGSDRGRFESREAARLAKILGVPPDNVPPTMIEHIDLVVDQLRFLLKQTLILAGSTQVPDHVLDSVADLVVGDAVDNVAEKREALLALATQYPPGDIDDPEVFDAYSDELCALLWHGGSEPD